MDKPIEAECYKGHTIEVYYDLDAPDPLNMFGHCCDDSVSCQGECRQAEIDAWISSDVYGYVISGELCTESCWGFYGELDYCIEMAKGQIDYAVSAELRAIEQSTLIMAL